MRDKLTANEEEDAAFRSESSSPSTLKQTNGAHRDSGPGRVLGSHASSLHTEVKKVIIVSSTTSSVSTATSVKTSAGREGAKSKSAKSKNFFQQCSPFPSPDSDGRISTSAYIESVTSLAEFIGQIGLVFWSVRSDIIANIGAVKSFYKKSPDVNQWLDQLVHNDKTDSHKNSWFGWESIENSSVVNTPVPVTPTLEAFLWSHRSVAFFAYILEALLQEYYSEAPHRKESLLSYFRDAYQHTLAAHMTWMKKIMFELVLTAVPTRAQFLALLSGSGQNRLTESQVFEQLQLYVHSLKECNDSLHKCFLQNGYTP